MKQESFSDMEYRCRKKKTKREEFLEIMDEIIPWEEWVSLVVPHYPTGKRGRPPIEIETMLRMYLLQCWFSLSDEGVEDAIYDSYAMRKYMGINFFEQDVPDATTLLHFRHLLEEKGIGKLFFDAINRCLERAGRMMRGGSIVDATLISAPSSTKNAEKKRDPEMHSVKKGNQENICQGGFHSSEIPLWLSVSKDSTTVPQAPLTVAIDDPKSSISLQCASKTDGTTCPIFIAKYYSCRKRLPCSCICLIVFSRDKSIPLLCMY